MPVCLPGTPSFSGASHKPRFQQSLAYFGPARRYQTYLCSRCMHACFLSPVVGAQKLSQSSGHPRCTT